jgi:hypothetical protein
MLRDSRQKTKGPAIGLLVIGSLGLLGQLVQAISLLVTGLDGYREDMREVADQIARQIPDASRELLDRVVEIGPLAQIIVLLVGALGSLLVLAGGWSLLQVRNYGICVAACIVAAIPFCMPCCACLPLCAFGAPIGIWGLMVLMDDAVRDSFRGVETQPVGGPRAEVVVSQAPRPWAPPGTTTLPTLPIPPPLPSVTSPSPTPPSDLPPPPLPPS